MTDNIISDWLKSINLEIYTQSFIDNGYDELEVCKQIGNPDLDAIGVSNEKHRKIILDAVTKIKEEGGTSVYFTLETPEVATIEPNLSEKCVPGRRNSSNVESQQPHPTRRSCSVGGGVDDLVSYPRAQLRLIIRDKLAQDGIDLLSLPYTRRDWTACHSSMMTLAAKYAVQLRTHSSDVVERLEELRQWVLQKDAQAYHSHTGPSVTCKPGTPNIHSYTSHRMSSHTLPPALPDCPPPASSHLDPERFVKLQSVSSRQSEAFLYQPNYMTLNPETQDGEKIKKSSSLGRFFRNMGIRRSGKKALYKPHDGDLCAADITMSDEDRKALMIMVKDGTLSTDQAMAMVRRYEEEKRKEWQMQQQASHKGAQKKKKQTGKPVKSPSAVYTDNNSNHRCQICQRIISNDSSKASPNHCTDPSHRIEYFHHRRVHSVSHIDFIESPKSPEAARAMSCTPTRGYYPDIHSPVTFFSPCHTRLYSPVMQHESKIYHTGSLIYGQGADHYHGNQGHISSSFHESPSTISSLSMESEQSMECQNHSLVQTDLAASRGDNWNYGTYSSAMSVTSDAVCWRRNSELDDTTKTQKARCQGNTAKSLSSTDSNQSGGSGNMSAHSASPGSGKSSSSMEADGSPSNHDNTSSLVRVHTDYTPTKSEIDMLHIKKGDIIWVATRTSGGLWKGVLSGKTGWFRPSYTEPCSHSNTESSSQKKNSMPRRVPRKLKPRTVQELLFRIGLENLESVFLQNGFEHLDSFADLNENDLNALGITDAQQRAKLLTAAELLGHSEDDDFFEQSSYAFNSACYSPRMLQMSECSHRSCPGSRDSGCYGSWEHLGHKEVFNKQGYMISPKHQNNSVSPLHYNKENFPSNTQNRNVGEIRYICSRQANSSGRGSASSGRTSVETCNNCGESQVSDLDKSDRDFTEEDREVCEINRAVQKTDSPCLYTTGEITPQIGENCVFEDSFIVMCSYAGTQTSPGCDSSHRCSHFVNCNCDSSKGAMNATRSKPFPNKVRSKTSTHDAQIQVMCPYGNSSQITMGECSAYQEKQECAQRQSTTPASYESSESTPTSDYQRKFSSPVSSSVHSRDHVQYDKNVPKNRSRSLDNAKPVPSPRDFKSIKKSLVSMVTSKLADEKIDLSQEPYSTQYGQCCIPPLLVQRYAEELKETIPNVCTVLEQVRVHSLTSQHRTVIPSENLAEKCSTGSELKMSSIPEFFTSIGLPMYTSAVMGQNFKYIEQLFKLTNQEIRDISGASHKHAKRIAHALTWVRNKMAKQANSDETGLIDRV